MAEKPTTLLERLNKVLESLAIRMGAGSLGTGQPSSIPSGASASPTFLDPIKRLLERIAGAAEKAVAKRGSGPGSGSDNSSKTLLDQAESKTSPQQSKRGSWDVGTAPHGGPLHQGDPSDQWNPAPDFQQALNDLSPKEKVLPPTGASPAAGGGGLGSMDFKAWLGGGGAGAGSQAAGAGQAAMAGGAAGGPIAMAAMAAAEELKKKWGAIQGAGKSLAGTLSKEGPGDVAGGVFEAGEHAGDAIGGPVGEAVTKVSAFGKMVAESVDNLRRFDREIINASFRFGEFSSAMAAVEGQQEVRDIDIGMRKGDAQADSTAKLAEAMSELNETVLPFENQFANFKNEVLTNVTKLATEVIKASKILEVMKTLLEIISRVKADEDDDPDKENVLERLYKAGDMYARPDRFPE